MTFQRSRAAAASHPPCNPRDARRAVRLLLALAVPQEPLAPPRYPDAPPGVAPGGGTHWRHAASPAEMRPYRETIPGSDVGFDMLPVPGGTFRLGSPPAEKGRRDDEGPAVEVEVSPFWMGRCETTWDEYHLFMLSLDLEARAAGRAPSTPQDPRPTF